MRSSGERTHVYIAYRDSASVESTRGGSLTLAPITSRMLEHYGASVSEVADNTEARSQ